MAGRNDHAQVRQSQHEHLSVGEEVEHEYVRFVFLRFKRSICFLIALLKTVFPRLVRYQLNEVILRIVMRIKSANEETCSSQ